MLQSPSGQNKRKRSIDRSNRPHDSFEKISENVSDSENANENNDNNDNDESHYPSHRQKHKTKKKKKQQESSPSCSPPPPPPPPLPPPPPPPPPPPQARSPSQYEIEQAQRSYSGRARACEMSNRETGEVIQIFKSCSQMERVTGISRTTIGKACRAGGGPVEKYWVRFVFLNPKKPEEKLNTITTTTVAGTALTTTNTSQHPPPTVALYPHNPSANNANDAAPTTARHRPFENNTKHTEATQSTPRNDAVASPPLHDDSNTRPRRSSKESPQGQTPKPCHQLDHQAKGNQQLLTLSSAYRPPTSKHFDVLSLLPLQSKDSSKKKYVQLYCKGSEKELVCFRGSADAAVALNLDRKIISKMCERTKKGAIAHDAPKLDSFSLAYASNRITPKSYQYGVHFEDWQLHRPLHQTAATPQSEHGKPTEGSQPREFETYYERLARWEKTFLKERQREKNNNAHLALNKNPPTKEVPIKDLSSVPITSLHPNALVTAIQPTQLSNKNFNNRDMCLACQEVRAQVIFHPCQHCLICAKCSQNGLCQKFCPSCRTTITSTSQPAFLKLVKPRIYSAHLFM